MKLRRAIIWSGILVGLATSLMGGSVVSVARHTSGRTMAEIWPNALISSTGERGHRGWMFDGDSNWEDAAFS